jgi:hypothetical protein
MNLDHARSRTRVLWIGRLTLSDKPFSSVSKCWKVQVQDIATMGIIQDMGTIPRQKERTSNKSRKHSFLSDQLLYKVVAKKKSNQSCINHLPKINRYQFGEVKSAKKYITFLMLRGSQNIHLQFGK